MRPARSNAANSEGSEDMSEVLVEVTCAMCERTHDAFAEEQPNGRLVVQAPDLRCPSCDCPVAATVRVRESLA